MRHVCVGGALQQVSNGAFFKNTKASLRKLNQPPRTARNTPGLSEKSRVGHVSGLGVAGNPQSKAKNFIAISSIPRKNPAKPKED